jgi:putative ABC transport system permease protein
VDTERRAPLRQTAARLAPSQEGMPQVRLRLLDIGHDLRIAWRGLASAPLTTATILLTVGLGVGATTAMFAAIDAVLLRPLPYTNADRLVQIYTDSPPNRFPFSVADYLALAAQQTQFEQVAAYTGRQMAFTDGATAERLTGRAVSWTFFSVLGVRPALGRDFVEDDGRPNHQPVVIVSDSFWHSRLGGRTDALNRAIQLDGGNYIVVGVLAPAVGPIEQQQDFFVPVQFIAPPRKGPFFLRAIGRLKPGVSPAAAAQELRAINARIFPLWRASYQDERATWSLTDLRSYVVGDIGGMARLALCAVLLVWVIACTNASNLLVARVTSRRRELAVRAALGASRGRIISGVLAEAALLAAGAAALGIAVANALVGALRAAGSAYVPRTAEIGVSGDVLWMLAGLTAGSACLFGLIPAVHAAGVSTDRVNDALRSAGRGATGTRGTRRLRQVLVASQFAVATPLLVAGGLLLVSLARLSQVDLGFDRHNVLTGSIMLPVRTYPPAKVEAFWPELQRRAEAIPGVTAVAFSDGRPPNDVNNFNNFDLEDAPTPPGGSQPVVPWLAVSPEYFRLLGLALVDGRLLDQRDALLPDTSEQPIVVDRAWVRRFFPRQSAVGRRLREGGCTTCPWTVVVGVVSEVKYAGLDKPDDGTVYAPLGRQVGTRDIELRTTADPGSVLAALRETMRALDPGLPLSSVATIDDLVDRSVVRPRTLSLTIGALASVALALSVIGIYGVMAYYVQQHAKELGIRAALGSGRAALFRMVVSQGMTVVAGGMAAGLIAAAIVGRAMSSFLFGVGTMDPATFGAVALVLTSTAFAACALPAIRAIRLDPAIVLRDE